MRNFPINYQCLSNFRITMCWILKINHQQHKKVLLCTIDVFYLWLILKQYFRPSSTKITRYNSSDWIIKLYVVHRHNSYNFYFFHFIQNLSIRLEMLHQSFYAEMILRNWNDEWNQIRMLELYSILYRFFHLLNWSYQFSISPADNWSIWKFFYSRIKIVVMQGWAIRKVSVLEI